MSKTALEVVVALIVRQVSAMDGTGNKKQYLLSQRSAKQSYAGLWEFPGGKVEKGESEVQALQRELVEELGVNIDTQNCPKVMSIPWQDNDLVINLHIYEVNDYALSPYSAEGQTIQWWDAKDIYAEMLPPANRGLIGAINLPEFYAISGEFANQDDFIHRVERSLQKGIKLLQIRVSHNVWMQWREDEGFLQCMNALGEDYDSQFLLNAQCVVDDDWQLPSLCARLVGWHLRANDLERSGVQQVMTKYNDYLWGASVHSEKELLLSEDLGVDFLCISPILPTLSDNRKKPIGFRAAAQLSKLSTVPVYYLGGMSEQHLLISQQSGAQGIAAISSFWSW